MNPLDGESLEHYRKLRKSFEVLNDVEIHVLRLLVKSLPNHEIAERMGLDVRDLEAMRASIIEKMNAKTMSEVIRRVASLNRLNNSQD